MKEYCPKCKELREFKFYDGFIGYESIVCAECGFDANDTTIQDLTTLYNKNRFKMVVE
jgi:uncharacterized protein (DUF983 family)